MKYNNITQGTFIERPNRFVAVVDIDGKKEICHVKNTGRCREILKPGTKVVLSISDNPERKTKYDLIAAYKGNLLINIDSQAPNKVFGEWVKGSGFFGKITYIKPECKYKNSRFDYYIETENDKIFVEIKGVTLEENGVCRFPDAPTERGIKHLKELSECVKEGFGAYVFFIVQMDYGNSFEPNRKTHPEFADALCAAKENGVNVICMNCKVTEDTLLIEGFIKEAL